MIGNSFNLTPSKGLPKTNNSLQSAEPIMTNRQPEDAFVSRVLRWQVFLWKESFLYPQRQSLGNPLILSGITFGATVSHAKTSRGPSQKHLGHMFGLIRKWATLLSLADPLSWPNPKSSYLKLKSDVVDGDGVLPGIILRDTRQKRLCKVESGDPKDHRGSIVNPFLNSHRNRNSKSTKHQS